VDAVVFALFALAVSIALGARSDLASTGVALFIGAALVSGMLRLVAGVRRGYDDKPRDLSLDSS
jgi:hypothetical protein